MKIGDKIRFLNAVGGGVVVGFQGKDVALVRDDDGFDVPTLVKECVVVTTDEYNLARPQAAASPAHEARPDVTALHDLDDEPADRPITFKPRPLERRGGDVLNVMLAFVPANLKELSQTTFEMHLVNDSNYTLRFALMGHEGKTCVLLHEGEVAANTKLFLEEFGRDALGRLERLTLQALVYKEGKPFLPKPPVNVGVRVEGPRFYKLHAFRENDFFEQPALLVELVHDDRPVRSVYVEAAEVEDVIVAPRKDDRPLRQPARKAGRPDPTKPLEIDLHADALLETTAGLEPRDILEFQLKTFRETMALYRKERGRKIVFIHGKGEGVLRQSLIGELKAHYPQCRWQDASFREYGFGATLVTI